MQKIKISIYIFLICFLFQNSYSQQNMNGWYWVNGQPQSNTLNWVKIIDSTHYYALGENGTFMKSSDKGVSWLINSQSGITDPYFGSGATLRLFSGWFFDANTGYVTGQSVSGDGGFIRKTTNGGESFSNIALGLGTGIPRVYDIYFINSNTGFICGNETVNVMKTVNGGTNWTSMSNLPSKSYIYNCIYAIDENNILMGVSSEGVYRNVVRTTNGGTTWIEQTLPAASIIVDFKDIVFQNANTGYISGNGTFENPAYFAYTTNAGSTWTNPAFPNNKRGLYDLEIIGSTVYVLGTDNSYFYTSNLGVTWDSVNFRDPLNVNQPYEFIVYAFDINGDDAIVVGINGTVNISNNGGSSWRNVNYSVGNNMYCFYSIIALPGTQNVWAGTNGGGQILYSANRGTNWTLSQTSATGNFCEIEMLNSNTGFASGGDYNLGAGYCYRTLNGGVNWTATTPLPTPGIPRYGLSFVNEKTGWVFGGYEFGNTDQIVKTTNGGVTWVGQVTNPQTDTAIYQGDMADASTGYCIGPAVYKTTNGGSNWNKLDNVPTYLRWSNVKAFTDKIVYLGGNQRIYKTTDGGENWSETFIPTSPTVINNMDWTDLNNGMVVGTQGYTAKTTNGGITWTERNTGSSTLLGVSMASKDTIFAACTINEYGAIFRLYDTPVTSINPSLGMGIPAKFDLSQNYPNPFNPSTSINFEIPFSGKVSLKIFDMTGKEIATLVNEVKTAGYYSYNFDASGLSSGVYFYSLSADNFTMTKKMLLVK